MKPHKWAKEIKAWADGAEIEYRKKNGYGSLASEWQAVEDADNSRIDWSLDNFEFRIKPTPKEPQYLYVSTGEDGRPMLSFIDHVEAVGKIKLEQYE
jgi:hypothetical protein